MTNLNTWWDGTVKQPFILIFHPPPTPLLQNFLTELTHKSVSNIIFFFFSFVLLSALMFVIREIVIFILLSVLEGLCKRNKLQRCAKQALFIILFHVFHTSLWPPNRGTRARVCQTDFALFVFFLQCQICLFMHKALRFCPTVPK